MNSMRIVSGVSSPEEGLKRLLDTYASAYPPYAFDGQTLTVGGEAVPLLPWRCERRFVEMKKLLSDGNLGGICSMRAMRTAGRDETLDEALGREIGVCLWLSGENAAQIFCVRNEGCANAILRFVGGATAIIEAACTLSPGAEPAERHEVITDHGMTTDMPIDTLIPQQSVYEYVEGQPAAGYTDVDFELYGLTRDQAARARAAYDALTGGDMDGLRRQAARIKTIVEAAKRSDETRSVIAFGEGGV